MAWYESIYMVRYCVYVMGFNLAGKGLCCGLDVVEEINRWEQENTLNNLAIERDSILKTDEWLKIKYSFSENRCLPQFTILSPISILATVYLWTFVLYIKNICKIILTKHKHSSNTHENYEIYSILVIIFILLLSYCILSLIVLSNAVVY